MENISYTIPEIFISLSIMFLLIFGVFKKQSEKKKKKILGETELVVSIEASETNYWKKYTGTNGLNFGINDFGKSAPYKKIYNHFKLNSESIVKKIKEKL